MTIKKANFYKIFQDEGAPFYIDEYNIDENHFNHWVSENFKEIASINDFKEIVPSRKTIDKFTIAGYVHRPYQCHYSAKAISILDSDYEYWTGFVHRQDNINYPIITHSFNIFKGTIVDFSRLNQDFSIYTNEDLYLPHVYYGINIPSGFVEEYRESVFNQYSMKPLLFEWYRKIKIK